MVPSRSSLRLCVADGNEEGRSACSRQWGLTRAFDTTPALRPALRNQGVNERFSIPSCNACSIAAVPPPPGRGRRCQPGLAVSNPVIGELRRGATVVAALPYALSGEGICPHSPEPMLRETFIYRSFFGIYQGGRPYLLIAMRHNLSSVVYSSSVQASGPI
jgi:hypothetical protein